MTMQTSNLTSEQVSIVIALGASRYNTINPQIESMTIDLSALQGLDESAIIKLLGQIEYRVSAEVDHVTLLGAPNNQLFTPYGANAELVLEQKLNADATLPSPSIVAKLRVKALLQCPPHNVDTSRPPPPDAIANGIAQIMSFARYKMQEELSRTVASVVAPAAFAISVLNLTNLERSCRIAEACINALPGTANSENYSALHADISSSLTISLTNLEHFKQSGNGSITDIAMRIEQLRDRLALLPNSIDSH